MKNNFFLTFFIFALVYISRYTVSGQQNLEQDANNLLTKLRQLGKSLIALRNQEEQQRTSVPGMADAIDFGISRDPQMIKTNEELKKNVLLKGIEECVKVRDDWLAIVKQTLRPVFKEESFMRIDAIRARTSGYITQVESMQNNLQGNNLQNIIGICKSTPSSCAITKEYPEIMSRITQSTAADRKLLNSVFDDVLRESIAPLVPAKVNNDIYTPVMKCIKSKSG